MNSSEEFEFSVRKTLNIVENLLLTKNRKYGNSALAPVRIFSKSDNLEQIRVRIDDKLSRISSSQEDEDEDVIIDLMGYLVIYYIQLQRQKCLEKEEFSSVT